MAWKMDGEAIALKDGNPIWVGNDGNEIAADYGHALGKINELTGESTSRKHKLREYEDKLKPLDGIDNPAEFLAEARKAMDTMKNLDAKKLIDAGEVDKVKGEVQKAMQAKIDEANARAEQIEATLNREMIGGRFSRSKYIADKLAIPPDLVEARFGANFKIEDGKVVALDQTGNKIFSREKPGDLADFDEAVSILVENYPHKASILKGSTASGGGAQGGNGGGSDKGGKTITRATFDQLGPADKVTFAKSGGKVVD